MKKHINIHVLYEHEKIFVVKLGKEYCHLVKNEFTQGIKEKEEISITVEITEQNYQNNSVKKILTPLGMPIKDKQEQSKKIAEPLHEYKKFLIHSNQVNDYKLDEFIQRNNIFCKIKHIGKVFSFKCNSSHSGRSKKPPFNHGDPVCYVYYSTDEANWNANDFVQACQDYMKIINLIKRDGVKPRHKADLVADLKKLPTICDGRKKFMGGSWIAIDDEFIWYFSLILSDVDFENNIKINGQLTQCWRISKRLIKDKMHCLEKIDFVLFKSNAFPNITND